MISKLAIESSSWLAIGLSLLAGLCTAFGGCIVYFKSLVKLANKSFLSGALGFSAGVMLFLSFYEIFSEGVHHFSAAGLNDRLALLYGSLSLFVGIIVAWFLELLLHKGSNVEFELPQGTESSIQQTVHGDGKKVSAKVVSRQKQSEGEIIHNPIVDGNGKPITTSPTEEGILVDMPKSGYEVKSISGSTRDLSKPDYFIENNEKAKLKAVGVLSAIAIALHNIPEGIVTYIGYVDNPIVGISLAIGIAAHNIPEGLSVALPVYYATNSRGKAFLWSLLSGLAEPLGAFLCMLFLQRFVNDYIFGFLFGFTGGVMTYICIYELIPTGIQLDCEKNYTTVAFVFGMGFIIISLILLSYSVFYRHSKVQLLTKTCCCDTWHIVVICHFIQLLVHFLHDNSIRKLHLQFVDKTFWISFRSNLYPTNYMTLQQILVDSVVHQISFLLLSLYPPLLPPACSSFPLPV